MNKPLIGLTPLFDLEQQRLWMRPNYMQMILEAGGIPVVLPLTENPEDIKQLAQTCDGFLFTGGPDIHPSRFGEETMRYCGVIDERRDSTEISLLREVMELEKPVLGICRGIQLINVALGGTLYQDIPAQGKGEPIAHDQHKPYDVPVHTVFVEKNSPLFRLTGKEKLMVNSMHHQAVRALAPALKCAAKSLDGLTEAIFHPEKKYFLAVQWHPEYLFQKYQDEQKIISAFVDAAKI